MDPFFGEIRIFPFNFPPRDWAFCRGQVIPIQQNPALASLLSNRYGGDGSTTFALPNLQSRAVMGAMGTMPDTTLGAVAGSETVALTVAQLPSHTHTANGISPPIAAYETAAPSATSLPIGPVNMTNQTTTRAFSSATAANVTFAPNMVGASPNPTSNHENRQPYLALNFCICTDGIYPDFP